MSSIGQLPVDKYNDWVGLLHLSTMWNFKEVQFQLSVPIFLVNLLNLYTGSEQSPISDLLNGKPVLKRMDLG